MRAGRYIWCSGYAQLFIHLGSEFTEGRIQLIPEPIQFLIRWHLHDGLAIFFEIGSDLFIGLACVGPDDIFAVE